jgi:hypothetical protein
MVKQRLIISLRIAPRRHQESGMALVSEAEKFSQVSPVLPELPRAANLKSVDSVHTTAADEERNPIFDALVSRDGEIAGLVAYSIYKQNKRAWLQDFLQATGRPPTDAESRAYIIGESTERRLATYRHLAAATLAGQGPDAPGGYAKQNAPVRSSMFYVVGLAVLVGALGVLWYALHAGVSLGVVK